MTEAPSSPLPPTLHPLDDDPMDPTILYNTLDPKRLKAKNRIEDWMRKRLERGDIVNQSSKTIANAALLMLITHSPTIEDFENYYDQMLIWLNAGKNQYLEIKDISLKRKEKKDEEELKQAIRNHEDYGEDPDDPEDRGEKAFVIQDMKKRRRLRSNSDSDFEDRYTSESDPDYNPSSDSNYNSSSGSSSGYSSGYGLIYTRPVD